MPSTDDHMLADLRAQAEAMDGSTALPRRDDGEPVFDQPWQGRAVAIAIETVAALGLSWDDFRDRLIAAIGADPHRDYYESWLAALDELVADHHLASRRRSTAPDGCGGLSHHRRPIDDLEVFPVPADEQTLHELLTITFGEHWRSIRFGTLIQGAVHEIAATQPPRTTMLDGYLTIDLGNSHLHLCIGEHRGAPDRPVDPDLARRRRCAHAELQRQWIDGAPARGCSGCSTATATR
jgi:nitrile hydratase accessory protein